MSVLRFEEPLSAEEMARVMTAIMDGTMPAEDIHTFLLALARRGETSEEIAAATQVMRAHAVPLTLPKSYALCDTCGTGGDGQGTFNISTLAALVAAAAGGAGAGGRIAKHGNRAAWSRCGSADLLEALGVNLDGTPKQVARSIEEAGFGFCFAPRFHPAMKAVAPIRKALGIRTLFNLIGPLANPAPLAFQLVGVSEAKLLQPMVEALLRLGLRRALVVHGRDGLDEVTTTGPTDALELRVGRISERVIDPAQLGVPQVPLEALRGGDATHNAGLAREVLSGAPSALRDIVVLNAGCAIYCAEGARTIEEGMQQAHRALDSGAARRLLQRVKELSAHAR